ASIEIAAFSGRSLPYNGGRAGARFLLRRGESAANNRHDKSLQFVVCSNGASGTIGEHTMLDALALSELNDDIAEAIISHRLIDSHLLSSTTTIMPEFLPLEISATLKTYIDQVRAQYADKFKDAGDACYLFKGISNLRLHAPMLGNCQSGTLPFWSRRLNPGRHHPSGLLPNNPSLWPQCLVLLYTRCSNKARQILTVSQKSTERYQTALPAEDSADLVDRGNAGAKSVDGKGAELGQVHRRAARREETRMLEKGCTFAGLLRLFGRTKRATMIVFTSPLWLRSTEKPRDFISI
ncbi:hypothetical protein F5Y09DRAFT_352545, partial [Xylaria sp. FL1042]